jgi:membrane-bound ClpP family serine protease
MLMRKCSPHTLVSGTGSASNARLTLMEVEFTSSVSPDFGTKVNFTVYELELQTQVALSLEKEFTITILNVNEAPILSLSSATIGVVGITFDFYFNK